MRFEFHDRDSKTGKSTGSWSEVAADYPATDGAQFVKGGTSKGVRAGRHVYAAVAVYPAGGDAKGRPAPRAVSGRFTVRQDKS